jgi:hypothetical protein
MFMVVASSQEDGGFVCDSAVGCQNVCSDCCGSFGKYFDGNSCERCAIAECNATAFPTTAPTTMPTQSPTPDPKEWWQRTHWHFAMVLIGFGSGFCLCRYACLRYREKTTVPTYEEANATRAVQLATKTDLFGRSVGAAV